MKLAKRLQSIGSFVSKDAVLIDVGCDHGLLGIYLLEKKLVNYVYASDISEGPLKSVHNNINKYQMSEQMEAVLSDGLAEFENICFTDVAIAGMGGSLIIDILDANLALLQDKNLILQPNINVEGLRRYLLTQGFTIIDETVLNENNINYNIINATKKANENIDLYQPIEIAYGRHNLINNNALTIEMMKADYIKYQQLLEKVINDPVKYNKFKKKMNIIKEYLDEIE